MPFWTRSDAAGLREAAVVDSSLQALSFHLVIYPVPQVGDVYVDPRSAVFPTPDPPSYDAVLRVTVGLVLEIGGKIFRNVFFFN